MSQLGFRSKIIIGILIALFFGVALYLRIALPYDQVFSGDWIKFTGVDAYYHLRIVDNLVHNFPHLSSFDPYFIYPGGNLVGAIHLFDYLLAGVVWLVGLGSPTQHTVDIVGVYFPAVLGALAVIPVYFIGRELFGRWAGVASAGLIAIMPGEFLGRSILGFADHHVAEVLFTALAVLFLILAVKAARDRELGFARLRWAAAAKPLLWGILAGAFLGVYLLTWDGALLFVLIFLAYLAVQSVVDRLRGKSVDYLCFVGAVTFAVALLVSFPALGGMAVLSLLAALAVPLALVGLSRLLAGKKPVFYLAALSGFGLAGWEVLHIASPSLLKAVVGRIGLLFVWPVTAVSEMRPFLFPGGDFTFALAWGNFATGSILCLVSLGILIWLVAKRGDAEKTLLVVWSLVIIAATLAMRRFAYYFAVNVALLAGYLLWRGLELALKSAGRDIVAKRTYAFFGIIAIFFVGFFPSISPAVATASQTPFAPSDAWCESLDWMRDNTPEPFGNSDCYYELYSEFEFNHSFTLEGSPQPPYGVVSWWDYGYWVTRIGHRVPTSNPGTGHFGEGRLLLAQDGGLADKIMKESFVGSRYVAVDYTLVTGKFYAVAALGGSGQEDFYGTYYLPQEDGGLQPVTLFYPEYYRSLVVRLYNFGGEEVAPADIGVVSWREVADSEGEVYRVITIIESFSDYGEAEAYVASQEPGNWRIAGSNPFVSPVPMEALERFRLVYGSADCVLVSGVGRIPEVKIFEYNG